MKQPKFASSFYHNKMEITKMSNIRCTFPT